MTDGTMIGDAVQKIAEQTVEQAGDAVPDQAPDEANVARFKDAMEMKAEDPAATQVESPLPSGSGKVNAPESLGDAIINGMEKLKAERDEQISGINETLEKAGDKNMTFKDAMDLQFKLMQLNLQQDLTTKSADKSSQGVQTLFRNQ